MEKYYDDMIKHYTKYLIILGSMYNIVYFKPKIEGLNSDQLDGFLQKIINSKTPDEICICIEDFFDTNISGISINHLDMMETLSKTIFKKINNENI